MSSAAKDLNFRWWRRSSPMPVFVITSAMLLLMPLLLTNPYHLNVATNAAITLIIALSLNLVVGWSGQFVLCHAAFFGLGAYVPGLLAARFGLSPWLGLFAGLVATGFIAALVSIPAARLHGYFLSVATLAFGLFVEIVVRQATDLTGGAYGVTDLPPLVLLGYAVHGRGYYLLTAIMLLLVGIMLTNLSSSVLGRSIIAMRDDPEAAAASGINVAQMRVFAFVFSAVIAALAGWLQAFLDRNINPHMLSPELTFVWLFLVLIGGLGSAAGIVLAALLLMVAPNFIGIAGADRVLVVGIVMIAIALFTPRGLGGLVDAVLNQVRRLTAMQSAA